MSSTLVLDSNWNTMQQVRIKVWKILLCKNCPHPEKLHRYVWALTYKHTYFSTLISNLSGRPDVYLGPETLLFQVKHLLFFCSSSWFNSNAMCRISIITWVEWVDLFLEQDENENCELNFLVSISKREGTTTKLTLWTISNLFCFIKAVPEIFFPYEHCCVVTMNVFQLN